MFTHPDRTDNDLTMVTVRGRRQPSESHGRSTRVAYYRHGRIGTFNGDAADVETRRPVGRKLRRRQQSQPDAHRRARRDAGRRLSRRADLRPRQSFRAGRRPGLPPDRGSTSPPSTPCSRPIGARLAVACSMTRPPSTCAAARRPSASFVTNTWSAARQSRHYRLGPLELDRRRAPRSVGHRAHR